jgi:hypothetical protein
MIRLHFRGVQNHPMSRLTLKLLLFGQSSKNFIFMSRYLLCLVCVASWALLRRCHACCLLPVYGTGKLEHNSMTVCQINRGLRFDPKMISLVYIHGMFNYVCEASNGNVAASATGSSTSCFPLRTPTMTLTARWLGSERGLEAWRGKYYGINTRKPYLTCHETEIRRGFTSTVVLGQSLTVGESTNFLLQYDTFAC